MRTKENSYTKLQDQFLSCEEIQSVARYYRNRKRQYQYIFARIITKKLFWRWRQEEYLDNDFDYKAISISNVKQGIHKGMPLLKMNDENINLNLSLTHTEEMIGGSIGKGCRVGIDIEGIVKFSESLMITAFTEEERKSILKFAPHLSIQKKMSLFWAIKEAIVKAIGVGFHFGLKSIQVEPRKENCLKIILSKEYKKYVVKTHGVLHIGYFFTKSSCCVCCVLY